MSKNSDFFSSMAEQSNIKCSIISEYFTAWIAIIRGAQKARPSYTQRVHYLDLFCGQGVYDNGEESTPVKVMRQILNNRDYKDTTLLTFNDANKSSVDMLKEYLEGLEGYDSLAFKPDYNSGEVDPEWLEQKLRSFNMIPTLCLLDPFGYKGLSVGLIDSVVNHWGSDCIVFFNFNRINMGIRNNAVRSHMDRLFGESGVEELSEIFDGNFSSKHKEDLIINKFAESLRFNGDRYVLAFSFPQDTQERTSHHLIFVTKDFKGYEVMKSIMFKYSSAPRDGVNGFGYVKNSYQLSFLDQMTWGISELADSIMNDYRGKVATRDEIYKAHSVNTRFLQRHYNDALKILEKKGKLTFSVPDGKVRRKNTYPAHCSISFEEEGVG